MYNLNGLTAAITFFFALFALFMGWERPIPILWWCVLVSNLVGSVFEAISDNMIRMHGFHNAPTKVAIVASHSTRLLTFLLSLCLVFL